MFASAHAILAFGVALGAQRLMAAGRLPGTHGLSMNAHFLELWNPFFVEVIAGLGPGSRSGGRPTMRRNTDSAKRKNVFLVRNALTEIGTTGAAALRHTSAFGRPCCLTPKGEKNRQKRNQRIPRCNIHVMFSPCRVVISINLFQRSWRMTQELVAVGHHGFALGAKTFASRVEFRQPCIRLLRCRMLPKQFAEDFDVVAGA